MKPFENKFPTDDESSHQEEQPNLLEEEYKKYGITKITYEQLKEKSQNIIITFCEKITKNIYASESVSIESLRCLIEFG